MDNYKEKGRKHPVKCKVSNLSNKYPEHVSSVIKQ